MSDLALLGGEPLRRTPFHGWPVYGAREEQYLLDVLRCSTWTVGKRSGVIEEFERRFAEYHATSAAVACTNCTHALEVMLSVSGVQPGDEVIVPAYTFIATASAVARLGAIPVFADIEPDTYVMDIASVEAVISARTRAVVPVHFAGHFVDMERLRAVAEKHGLVVIEDAAQAHGAKWNGVFPGHHGVAAGFSFQYSKNMTAGEGGVIISRDGDFVERCWEHIWHGRKRGGLWYEHFEATSNYRMTEWSAAILLAQLERLEEQNARRMANAMYLTELLDQDRFVFAPKVDPRTQVHPRHLFPMRINREVFGCTRKKTIVLALAAEGIPAFDGYDYPVYRTPAFDRGTWGLKGISKPSYRNLYLSVAEEACSDTLWFAHPVLLGTREDMEDLAGSIKKMGEHATELRAVSS